MFERLFKNKKYLFSYLLSLVMSLSTPIFGAMPFMVSYFGALVNNKIPTLIPFVIMAFASLVRFGFLGVLKFAIPTILFAMFISLEKEKDSFGRIKKLLVSCVIGSALMLITKQLNISLFPAILLEIVLILLFYIVFEFGLKTILDVSNEKYTAKDLASAGILAMTMFSAFYQPIVFGISIFSLVSVVSLMIICWKKPALFGVIAGIFFASLYISMRGAALVYVPLFIIAGVISSLLSRAGKNGALIGLAFTLVYTLMYGVTHQNTYDDLGLNERVLQDYANFIEKTGQLSGEGSSLELSGEMNTFSDKEVAETIRRTSEPGTASIVLKEMLVGFILLYIMPDNKYTEKIDNEDIKKYLKKAFPNKKILSLNPGIIKNNKEKKK